MGLHMYISFLLAISSLVFWLMAKYCSHPCTCILTANISTVQIRIYACTGCTHMYSRTYITCNLPLVKINIMIVVLIIIRIMRPILKGSICLKFLLIKFPWQMLWIQQTLNHPNSLLQWRKVLRYTYRLDT